MSRPSTVVLVALAASLPASAGRADPLLEKLLRASDTRALDLQEANAERPRVLYNFNAKFNGRQPLGSPRFSEHAVLQQELAQFSAVIIAKEWPLSPEMPTILGDIRLQSRKINSFSLGKMSTNTSAIAIFGNNC